MFYGPGGSKSRLAKSAGAEPSVQMRGQKVHVVVARSRFPSQNGKHVNAGALLEVEVSNMCTPLWRGAHFEVNI